MQKRAAYTIQCGIAACSQEFPIVVMIDDSKDASKAPTSHEVECPFCQTMLTFEVPAPLVNDITMLRGVKKVT